MQIYNEQTFALNVSVNPKRPERILATKNARAIVQPDDQRIATIANGRRRQCVGKPFKSEYSA